MTTKYADYKDVDQDQLCKDIDAIKETIGDPTQEDFDHLLKLERWSKSSCVASPIVSLIASISICNCS